MVNFCLYSFFFFFHPQNHQAKFVCIKGTSLFTRLFLHLLHQKQTSYLLQHLKCTKNTPFLIAHQPPPFTMTTICPSITTSFLAPSAESMPLSPPETPVTS